MAPPPVAPPPAAVPPGRGVRELPRRSTLMDLDPIVEPFDSDGAPRLSALMDSDRPAPFDSDGLVSDRVEPIGDGPIRVDPIGDGPIIGRGGSAPPARGPRRRARATPGARPAGTDGRPAR